jgi:hypothetical protein
MSPIARRLDFNTLRLMKGALPVRMNLSDRLITLRRLDPVRKWESLDDRRFCRCCRKFISGRQIDVLEENRSRGQLRLVCPTENCSSTPAEWVYPNEIAQPLNRWGRRVLRAMKKRSVKLIPAPAA